MLACATSKDSAHNGIVFSVAFNHDGTKIVSGSEDRTIKVWDAGTQPALLLT